MRALIASAVEPAHRLYRWREAAWDALLLLAVWLLFPLVAGVAVVAGLGLVAAGRALW